MPVCRNCNSRISTFDKDRCPVCGCENPIAPDHSDTIEITSNFSLDKELKKEVKVKKKVVALLLSLLVPFFGTPFYYLRYYKYGLLWLLINIFVIGLGFLLGFFVIFKNLTFYYSIIFGLGSAYVFNIGIGLYFMLKKDYKDGVGELVR